MRQMLGANWCHAKDPCHHLTNTSEFQQAVNVCSWRALYTHSRASVPVSKSELNEALSRIRSEPSADFERTCGPPRAPPFPGRRGLDTEVLPPSSLFHFERNQEAVERLFASILGRTLRSKTARTDVDAHGAAVPTQLPPPWIWSVIGLENPDVVVWLRCHKADR